MSYGAKPILRNCLFPAFSIKMYNLYFPCRTNFLYLNIKCDSVQEHFKMFYAMEKWMSVSFVEQPIYFAKLPINKKAC